MSSIVLDIKLGPGPEIIYVTAYRERDSDVT